MRSKGSRFTLGVWGLSCVRQTLPNRSQLSATVRNRSREVAMAVPMVSSAKRSILVVFQRRVASFRMASVALSDIPTCFMTCQEWFCVAGAVLLQRFQKMRYKSFSWQNVAEVALWRPPVSWCHFAWQAEHFRHVVLRVFCKLHCQCCGKWRQRANSVAGVTFCDM